MVDIEDITLWTAVATWGLAVGTVALLYWQTRQNYRLNSANAVMILRERFDSPRMRRARRSLASSWLSGKVDDITSLEVLTFFELMGAQTASGVLDERMVWEAFGGWITAYYWSLRNPVDMIGDIRAKMVDPLIFHEFEWLYNRMIEIDRQLLGSEIDTGPQLTQESRRFLERESRLEAI